MNEVIPIKTWNPTKIFSWLECPYRTQLRYAQHLCPICFQGSVPYDGACSACKQVPQKAAALARGISLDAAITAHIGGAAVEKPEAAPLYSPPPHPKVRAEVATLKNEYTGPTPIVILKHQISLDDQWRPLPRFTKGPWFWGELDVLVLYGMSAKVTDWKSGGVNKEGKPYSNDNYEDQLEIYGIATLCAHPRVIRVEPRLVFIDARPPHEPTIKCDAVLRTKLVKLKKKWEKKINPMLTDTEFVPRPGPYCTRCDYARSRGGPCKFGG